MAYDPVWQGYLSLQRSEAAADGPGRGLSNYRVQVWFAEIPKRRRDGNIVCTRGSYWV